MKLDKLDIDELAWENRPLPKDADRWDMIYYLFVRSIYAYVKNSTMELQKAKNMKQKLAHYYETVEMLALSNGKLISELNKLTAPRAELADKSREELLEIVVKMDALCSSIIRTAAEEVPEFFRVEKNKEVHNENT